MNIGLNLIPYLNVDDMVEKASHYIENPGSRIDEGQKIKNHIFANHLAESQLSLIYQDLAELVDQKK